MAKNNDQFAREKELARDYEKKMADRAQKINAIVNKKLDTVPINPHEVRGFPNLLGSLYIPAFSKGKYKKPSEFFLAEMPWIFGLIVYDRFKDAFLHTVDQIRDYPYSVGWGRRTFRSNNYLNYCERISTIVYHFREPHCIDADICDVLTGNLPEDAYSYLVTRKTRTSGFAPEVLAYELDRNNPRLESIVTDIINGESSFSTVSRDLICGIIMSHNSRMHELLRKLLVAAKLQEGLRQAICEEADMGTTEAFHTILSTILEQEMIRYSSVKRAVGTWIGVMTEETRDLDRISNKSVELICKCLKDTTFREECLASEDSMAIHIALWSYSFECVQNGYEVLDRIIESGTHHQVLTAGYFVANLESSLIKHVAARNVLKAHRDHNDILAVYLPSFIPYSNYTANSIALGKEDQELKLYFESPEEAGDFCDWLVSVHNNMAKKTLEFNPCIFPWYAASIKKSDLMEKAMVIAAMIQDQERIDLLCPHISDCDAFGREIYFKMLTKGGKTEAVRKAIINGLEDKNMDTRRAAFSYANGMVLKAEEYLQIENMLRLRYDDLRRGAMELLMAQSDDALQSTIRRLLASSKTQMRTAGLDMVTQLIKSENRAALAQSCMDAVHAISKPTTQEKILIDALTPQKAEEEEESLFSEEDRYTPAIIIDDYAKSCIAAFMDLFPQSKLEKQILAGKPVSHNSIKLPALSCAAAQNAQKNLKSLSFFFISHERDTFMHHIGREFPIGTDVRYFQIVKEGFGWTVPRMDLWEQWRDENKISMCDLFGMLISCGAQTGSGSYLVRCGKYMSDIYGPGFENRVNVRYEEHLHRIIHELIYENISEEQTQKLAMALGIWIAKCLPEDMLIGDKGSPSTEPPKNEHGETVLHYVNSQIHINYQTLNQLSGPAGHFIAHPQISRIFCKLNTCFDDNLQYRIPVLLNVYERTYASTAKYMADHGQPVKNRVTLVLNQLYNEYSFQIKATAAPDAGTYLYARHFGLISERSLYYHLMAPGFFRKALELTTAVKAMKPADGDVVSSKTFSMYNMYSIRRGYEDFIGLNTELSEAQLKLVQLCRQTADKLVPVVVKKELLRGDTPTEYSAYVSGIHVLSGMDTFVKILSALGKDSLDRTVYYWGSSQSKRGNLSYLLARCVPEDGDDAVKLAKLLAGTDITEKRLIEAALYSPAWIDIIGEHLNLPGFKSACYYFMAHMNERFDEQKKAIIARFTPLTEDELNLGAFDVDWFHSAFNQLGEKKFDLIYDAAKYISDGSKHTRARKFADAALGRLAVEETENAIKDKRNKDLLMAYAIIPLNGEEDLIHRYLYLQQFLKESRQFGSQRSTSEKKSVEAALRNLATNAGFSDTMRLTLRMETKLVENNLELFDEKQVGEWTFQLLIDDQGTAEIRCCKDGKQLKSIPTKAKKDPYVVRLQDMKKQLTEQYRRTRRMFEQAMEDGAEFTLEEMRQLCENPVVSPIVSKLIFKSEDALGLFDNANLCDLDGLILEDRADAKLIVAHPLHLYRSGYWHSFQKYLFENKIAQPFRQVFRELYVKTKEELGCFTSLRYAGNQIQPKKAAACLKERRWVADIEAGLQKIYYQDNIVATIYALADWFTPADIEAPTLEYVAFYDRKTGQALKIDDIPDVIFSEVMRDVDMAVSVAHAGGVDPETSHSTVEMRAAILSFTLPLLRLKNVKVEGSHAFIDGKLANYSVHLGSGVVHQLGGTMLNVLPVHSQHRGRFFLPFVDDDPKTAEIISKIILFAEDHKLKDPSILEQIFR